MTFYLIGLGLDKNSISADALEVLETCDEVYLETYTVNFPYNVDDLESVLRVKIKKLGRTGVEDESILKHAAEKNIALLVYGDCLSATTHMQLVIECKKRNIPCKIFNNSSIMTAVARTGLQLYKFGKTASMPNWEEHTNKPTSFMNYIKENSSIEAHTLLLTDIGLDFSLALKQLREASEKEGVTFEKIIAISMAGMDSQKIYYGLFGDFVGKNIGLPFCIIIPGKLHFMEEESLQELCEKV
jgi:diphthine synthase